VSLARFVRALLVALCCAHAITSSVAAQSPPADGLEVSIRRRVAERPDDAVSWRLLGKLLLDRGDVEGAIHALERSTRLDPDAAAAQFDLAQALIRANRRDEAADHLNRAVALAPGSDYATWATVQLADMTPTQPTRGAPHLPETRSAGTLWFLELGPDCYRVRFELGALYNSNVELAPISRELSTSQRDSFQGYFVPDIAYWVPVGESGKIGALFGGSFTLNEPSSDQFNLEHYQPGIFLEKSVAMSWGELVPRIEYDFSFDAFGGETLGTRHGVATSLLGVTDEARVWLGSFDVGYTDFRNDGTDASFTSLDGWTYTLRFAGARPVELWPGTIELGGNLQWTDVEGSTYRYHGVFVYGRSDTPLPWECSLGVQLGWGYRDYYDFELTPSRNENVWHASTELRKMINEHWSVSGIFTYDKFDSANEQFRADRFTTGLFTTLRY
jgi:hypothetical protein